MKVYRVEVVIESPDILVVAESEDDAEDYIGEELFGDLSTTLEVSTNIPEYFKKSPSTKMYISDTVRDTLQTDPAFFECYSTRDYVMALLEKLHVENLLEERCKLTLPLPFKEDV